jgi:DeoR family transcriptional regulator, fructose operon transcriptional repressor
MDAFDHSIRDSALPAKRHAEVLRLLRARGHMTVNELANHFVVSGDTIRRDLDHLAGQGLLERTHGGAVAFENLVHRDSTFNQRMGRQISAKKRIARAACGLIKDGETLLVNGGSTTRLFAAELKRRNLTIVTNNLSVPSVVAVECVRDLYLLGGQYKGDALVTVGPVLMSGVSITVDSAVIGVGGITVREGLTTTVLEEAMMIAAMIAAARRTIVLADATKLGERVFAHIAPLDRIQVLVTDEAPPEDLREALDAARVDVIVAPEG